MRALIVRVVAACALRPWSVVLAWALLCSGAVTYTARRIAIDTDSAKLISAELDWRQREAAFDAAFPQRVDLIAVVVDGATPEIAADATTRLTAKLAARPELFRSVRRPDGGAFFEQSGLLFESTEELSRLSEQLIAAQPLLGVVAADPSLRGVMDALSLVLQGVSAGQVNFDSLARPFGALAGAFEAVVAGQTPHFSWQESLFERRSQARELRRFIFVQPVLDYSALVPGARATDAIRRAAAELDLPADSRVRVRLTGPVPLADEEFATLAEGAALASVITLLVVVALLAIALRSARLIIAILLSLVAGLAVTTAFGLLVYGAFNLISVAFAVLFIGLGVDFGIQLCMSYRAERHAGRELQQALSNAAGEVGAGLALAAAATAAGFYAFLPTAYRGVSELGAIAGTGMLVAFAASITLLPALLALMRPPGGRAAVSVAFLAPLDGLIAAHRRGVLIAAGIAAVASLAALPRLEFDFDPLHLRSPTVESVATLLDLMQDPDTTPNTIDVLAPTLADAAAQAERLAALPEVDHVVTLASFIPEDQKLKLDILADAALLLDAALNPSEIKAAPGDGEIVQSLMRTARSLRELAAAHPPSAASATCERLALALDTLANAPPAARERAHATLIPGLERLLRQLRAALQAQAVALDTLPADLVRDWVAPDGRARIEVFPASKEGENATSRGFVAAVRTIAPDATGAPVSIQESGLTVMRAFMQAGLWALLAITVLLAASLQRASDMLLTLAPLLLASLVTLGICAAIGLPLNFENIIALPLLFGIGVAFNIYFVMARREADQLLRSSLARAILFSALTTAAAFGALGFSHHPGTSSMGKLLALSLACTLAAALVFLPALLGLTRSRTSGDKSK